jgi:hypothetical protein
MATERLSMRQIREILRQEWAPSCNHRNGDSKACYAFWGAERFCHPRWSARAGAHGVPPRLSRNPLGNLLRFG